MEYQSVRDVETALMNMSTTDIAMRRRYREGVSPLCELARCLAKVRRRWMKWWRASAEGRWLAGGQGGRGRAMAYRRR